MTVHDTEIDINLYFDFEIETPCEVGIVENNNFTDCDNKAEWKMVMKCCAGAILVCTAHFESDKKIYEWFEGLATCLLCNSNQLIARGDLPYTYYKL